MMHRSYIFWPRGRIPKLISLTTKNAHWNKCCIKLSDVALWAFGAFYSLIDPHMEKKEEKERNNHNGESFVRYRTTENRFIELPVIDHVVIMNEDFFLPQFHKVNKIDYTITAELRVFALQLQSWMSSRCDGKHSQVICRSLFCTVQWRIVV